MPVNLAEFGSQVAAAKELIPAAHLKLQGSVVERVMSDIVAGTPDSVPGTPYRTGYAKANWFPSVGQPSSDILPPFVESQALVGARAQSHLDQGEVGMPPGEAELTSLQRLPGVLHGARPFDVIYLSNNVSYIQDLEAGKSKQAPDGMAAIAVAQVSAAGRI